MQFPSLQPGRIVSKLFLIIVTVFSYSLAAFAQTSIAVAPNKLNVLYIGIDNPLSIAASGGTDDKITVSVSGGKGTIAKTGTGLYNVRVAEVTDECIVNVHVNDKLVGASNFRVRNLPVPTGTIGGFQSGQYLAANVFQMQSGIGVFVRDFPFEVQYEVLGFTFAVDDDKGDVRSFDCEGSYFSAAAKEYINQHITAGRTVTIDKIRVKDPGGKEWKIPSLVYFIK